MSAPPPARTCRLAICDDAYEYVRLLELVIEAEAGIEVVGTAEDGVMAIELCARVQPDVLLLDVAMPVMDGIAALPAIRRRSPGTKVVVLTGFASAEIERQARVLGAHDFILKGMPPVELVHRLRAACGVVDDAEGSAS